MINVDIDSSGIVLVSTKAVIMSMNLLLLSARVVLAMVAIGATSTYVAKKMNQQGVVTGILYIGDMEQGMAGSSIVVDGEILRQGETIHGAEVVKIEKFCAEFEKNGVRWTQKVRQQPDPAWKEPD